MHVGKGNVKKGSFQSQCQTSPSRNWSEKERSELIND